MAREVYSPRVFSFSRGGHFPGRKGNKKWVAHKTFVWPPHFPFLFSSARPKEGPGGEKKEEMEKVGQQSLLGPILFLFLSSLGSGYEQKKGKFVDQSKFSYFFLFIKPLPVSSSTF